MMARGLGRMVVRQVRSRIDRALALGAGILVASVSFSLLTATASTSQLAVHGTVDAAARPAYDILVRPNGAANAIETQDNLVRDNYLAGTFGGISIAQWQRILKLPNVTVAAPIANIGYVIPAATVIVPVGPLSSSNAHQIFRVNVSWKAANGLSTYPGGTYYVYYSLTDRLMILKEPDGSTTYNTLVKDVPGSAEPIQACPNLYRPTGGVDTGAEEDIACYSALTPAANSAVLDGLHITAPSALVAFSFPMMLSAVDPVQEAKLVGLPQTIVTGKYLSETDGLLPPVDEASGLPVIAASRTFLDDSLTASVQQLDIPAGVNAVRQLADAVTVQSFLQALAGPVVQHDTLSPQSSYDTLLDELSNPNIYVAGAPMEPGNVYAYWTSSGVRYQSRGQLLAPVETSNPQSEWIARTSTGSIVAPPGNEDTQFQQLTVHHANGAYNFSTGYAGYVTLSVVGRFDPTNYRASIRSARCRSRRTTHRW